MRIICTIHTRFIKSQRGLSELPSDARRSEIPEGEMHKGFDPGWYWNTVESGEGRKEMKIYFENIWQGSLEGEIFSKYLRIFENIPTCEYLPGKLCGILWRLSKAGTDGCQVCQQVQTVMPRWWWCWRWRWRWCWWWRWRWWWKQVEAILCRRIGEHTVNTTKGNPPQKTSQSKAQLRLRTS